MSSGKTTAPVLPRRAGLLAAGLVALFTLCDPALARCIVAAPVEETEETGTEPVAAQAGRAAERPGLAARPAAVFQLRPPAPPADPARPPHRPGRPARLVPLRC